VSEIQLWTLIFAVLTFSLYIYIAYASRAKSTSDFYVAGGGIPAPANGAAVAADWMSAASFISLAGIVGLSYNGYAGGVFLMGWTGGYVLLALLLAPYLRKFGKYTLPEFVGDRYSETTRLVAVVSAIVISFVYVAGQMGGVGIVFSRFLGVGTTTGVLIGMGIVFFYAVLGGMKGITWTQVAQYSVLIVAYLIPAVAVSAKVTGVPLPQIGFGRILEELNGLQADLGLSPYSGAFTQISMPNMILITAALMFGTAGLPHVIVRFYTAKSVRAARYSALWAIFFIALLYTTAPSVASFTKLQIIKDLDGTTLAEAPGWFNTWSDVGLITAAGGGPVSELTGSFNYNDVAINNDIIVLASPEIGGLPAPIVGLVAAGALAAALSTASGLLLVISSAVANDVYYKNINPRATEAQQLLVGRIAMGAAIVVAGYLGINPPGFVAEVVALAFGLAAAAFFPTLVLGIFWKGTTAMGAAAGMISGLVLTLTYMVFTLDAFIGGFDGIFGIPATGIGTIGMLINFAVTIVVSQFTPKPSQQMQDLVEEIRYPGRSELVAKHAAGEI